jgi:hypothetical protein
VPGTPRELQLLAPQSLAGEGDLAVIPAIEPDLPLTARVTDAFFGDAFSRLRSAGPGLEGIAGCPFLVFYGEVSDDSDGPMELCRPVTPVGAADPAAPTDIQQRVEPAHDEVFIRIAKKDMGWPALAPAADALEAWIREQRREPAGVLRQVLIADQRTAAPDTPVCDLSVPLRNRYGHWRGL